MRIIILLLIGIVFSYIGIVLSWIAPVPVASTGPPDSTVVITQENGMECRVLIKEPHHNIYLEPKVCVKVKF